MSDVPLKEHMETRLASLEKASELARVTLEKRLEGMNEFREQLRSQASLFVTRDYMEARLETIRKNKHDNFALFVSVVALIGSLAGVVIAMMK